MSTSTIYADLHPTLYVTMREQKAICISHIAHAYGAILRDSNVGSPDVAT